MSETMDQGLPELFQKDSHLHMWETWQAGKAGEPLAGEDARLFQVMQDHPEQYHLWDHLNEATEAEIMQGEANMVMHITVHSIVENQLAENEIPAVGQVLKVLIQKGLTRHEAVHQIALEATNELYRVLNEHKPYDDQHYIRRPRQIPLKIQAKPRSKKK